MGWKISKHNKPQENEKVSWVTDAGEVIDGVFIQGKFFVISKEGEIGAVACFPQYWIANTDWKK